MILLACPPQIGKTTGEVFSAFSVFFYPNADKDASCSVRSAQRAIFPACMLAFDTDNNLRACESHVSGKEDTAD